MTESNNIRAILVDKDKTKILEVMDKEGEMFLCYFFYSKRAVWLEKTELLNLSNEMYKDIKKGKTNGTGPEQPL